MIALIVFIFIFKYVIFLRVKDILF